MNLNYAQFQSTAKQLIQQFSGGLTFTLIRPESDGTETVMAKNIPATFDKRVAGFFNTTGGSVVVHEEDVLYLPYISNKAIPRVQDKLAYGSKGESYRITNVDFLRPDNKTYIYFMVTVQ